MGTVARLPLGGLRVLCPWHVTATPPLLQALVRSIVLCPSSFHRGDASAGLSGITEDHSGNYGLDASISLGGHRNGPFSGGGLSPPVSPRNAQGSAMASPRAGGGGPTASGSPSGMPPVTVHVRVEDFLGGGVERLVCHIVEGC